LRISQALVGRRGRKNLEAVDFTTGQLKALCIFSVQEPNGKLFWVFVALLFLENPRQKKAGWPFCATALSDKLFQAP